VNPGRGNWELEDVLRLAAAVSRGSYLRVQSVHSERESYTSGFVVRSHLERGRKSVRAWKVGADREREADRFRGEEE
jgi:hypothetical protein